MRPFLIALFGVAVAQVVQLPHDDLHVRAWRVEGRSRLDAQLLQEFVDLMTAQNVALAEGVHVEQHVVPLIRSTASADAILFEVRQDEMVRQVHTSHWKVQVLRQHLVDDRERKGIALACVEHLVDV